MKVRIDNIWNSVSRIGLREGEDVTNCREVILLNRLLFFVPIVMSLYLPAEIIINGFALVPYVIMMVGLFLIALLLNRYRFFRAAQIYLLIISALFICVMGLMAGRGLNNFVVLIPILLLGIIFLKSFVERMIVFFGISAMFVTQHYLFDIVPPQFGLTDEQREIFSVVFFILTLLFTLLVGIYFIGINREYEDVIVVQKERIELKNKEITDSINYARRIQAAILPQGRVVKELLGESFVLYKPKDIVAGDFYWVESCAKASDSDGELVIFAAADCTGHGVPGAMVSVVCNNALNRCVREFGLTDPAKILASARDIVIEEFGKSDEEVKDGMDISLCVWNKTTNTLQWAGANNPLWIVRNPGKQGTRNEKSSNAHTSLTEIKPDKQPVGKHSLHKPFTTHTVNVETGDCIYVFTDGYHDQFGGEKGKKFKAARMKEMLLGIHNRSMEEQGRAIETEFETWKKGFEQIDDVCVIGVRI